MTERKLETIQQFMNECFIIKPGSITPEIFSMWMKRLITTEFIVLLPNFSSYVNTYPNDVRQEMRLDAVTVNSIWAKLTKLKYAKRSIRDMDVVQSVMAQLRPGD